MSDQLDYRFEQARQASQLDQKDLEVAVSDRLQEVRIELHQGLTQVRQEMMDNLLQTRDKTDQRLQSLQESNEQRLEQMRQTVEEKLEKDLTDALTSLLRDSFKTTGVCQSWPWRNADSCP